MKTAEQVLEEVQITLQKSNKIIAEALSKVQETDQFFQSLGTSREQASRRLLEGGLLTTEQKQQMQMDLDKWQEELNNDLKRDVEQAQNTTRVKPKIRGLRI